MHRMTIQSGGVRYGIEAESEEEALEQIAVVEADIEVRRRERAELNLAIREWSKRTERIEARRKAMHRGVRMALAAMVIGGAMVGAGCRVETGVGTFDCQPVQTGVAMWTVHCTRVEAGR